MVIKVESLRFEYPSSKRTAVNDLSFTFTSGKIFGILGPNGSGKTTFFKILSTALPSFQGSVTILGDDLRAKPHEIRKKIGVTFQHPSLDKKLTVRENLTFQAGLYALSSTAARQRISELSGRMNFTDRLSDLVQTLSGGLARRVEVAKSLLHKPQLMLMDEPSTGLDPVARKDMWDYLTALKKEGVTLLVTTHLMEEADRCDELLVMHEGRAVAHGTPLELKEKIGVDVIRIETERPDLLQKNIKEKFQQDSDRIDQSLRIERAEGHKFIPMLVEAFPGFITSISVGKPTLEDVFFHETKTRFSSSVSEAYK